jgi:hypothetical protein
MTDSGPGVTQFPRLRNLQFSPFKEQDEQYIVLWDPSGLAQEKLLVPMAYFYLLQYFDGQHSLDQIGAEYLKRFGEFFLPDRLHKLVADLDRKLFLEGERVEAAKQSAVAAYEQAPLREAAFAGKSYEENGDKLQLQLESFFSSREGPGAEPSENKGKRLAGLVAPHYELRAAGPVYAWAYKELREARPPDLFVVLGTCHAGLKNLFAVTDKDFETPLGIVSVDRELVERLRDKGGAQFFAEASSHKHEHSIEFQLPLLQHVGGRGKAITIVPILCAFPTPGLIHSGQHAMAQTVETFLGTLKEVIEESGREVCVVASADLAHIGMRYGDPQPPTDFSFHRCMQSDLEMLKHVENLDPDAFAQYIQKEEDRRRICGFSPIYTLLKLIRAEKGQVLRYDRGITDQFNSTVTFASMAFY